MSVICQAGSLTRRFVVELERDAGSPEQNFSIKRDWHTLPGNPSDIVHINDYAEPDLSPDKKRHSSSGYGIEKTVIESISWQWLYASNLLIAYELFVITKVTLMSDEPYLWLPLEVPFAVAWLLKIYWKPNTQLFSQIEQQATSMLIREDHLFATITAVFGSTGNSPQYQSSESSSQPAPKATLSPISSFNGPLNNDYSGGNGGNQQHQHTLGLNCFIHPCHGFCQLQPLSSSSRPAEWPLNTMESSCVHQTTGHCSSCMRHFDPEYAAEFRQNPLINTLHELSDIQLLLDSDPLFGGSDGNLTDLIHDAIDAPGSLNDDVPMLGHLSSIADDIAVINGSLDLEHLFKEDEQAFTLSPSEIQQTTAESSQLAQSQPHLSRTGAVKAKAERAQKACELTVVGEDGQQRPCGKFFKSDGALANHKSKYHTGQKVCGQSVVGEDGQQRPCGKVLKNIKALWGHKSKCHSGQQTCKVIVFVEGGQQRPCGWLCKNASALTYHKTKYHSVQQTCEVTVVGEDGQQRPCGKVCKNAGVLSSHKSEYHRGQQICKVTVVGEDGQQRPCGKLCKNVKTLSNHKNTWHTGQKTCVLIMVGEDGQQRPCGKVCKNTVALLDHKSNYHSGQEACKVNLLGDDGQQRPCGRLCKNARALRYHKIKHHSRQESCTVNVFSEDGQQRPCGQLCINAHALSIHKSICHTGEQTCDSTVIGKDGQQRPCRKVCKNAKALSNHKTKVHSKQQHCQLTVIEDGRQTVCKKPQVLSNHKRRDRKRKHPVGEDDELSPPADKVNKCGYQGKLTD
ncbi:hypothetical protein [Endozoicomonas sp. ALB032]|uniref:hypothetical protein n=1 Tax=Endozoicomonas sp. ALB032 TaxID=3403082 RepID=UPI003BB688EA